jgi:hypothetical protein
MIDHITLGMVVWSVFCLGVGITSTMNKADPILMNLLWGIAIGMILWSVGVAIWMFVGLLLNRFGG